MCSALKQEFQVRNLGFNFHKEEAFHSAQWKWHPAIFLVFRVCVALYLVSFCLYMLIVDNKSKLFTFLTNLTLLFEMVTFVIGAVVAVVGYAKSRKFVGQHQGGCENANVANGDTNGHCGSAKEEGTKKSWNFGSARGLVAGDKEEGRKSEQGSGESSCKVAWYNKLSWFLFSMTDVLALLVTCAYFGALYPSRPNNSADNFHRHLVNSLLVLLDAVVSARPTRLLHVVYACAYGVAYSVFTVIYWAFDKDNNIVYPILDWNKPGIASAAVFGLGLVAIPLLTLLRFGLYRLRLFAYLKIYGEAYTD